MQHYGIDFVFDLVWSLRKPSMAEYIGRMIYMKQWKLWSRWLLYSLTCNSKCKIQKIYLSIYALVEVAANQRWTYDNRFILVVDAIKDWKWPCICMFCNELYVCFSLMQSLIRTSWYIDLLYLFMASFQLIRNRVKVGSNVWPSSTYKVMIGIYPSD